MGQARDEAGNIWETDAQGNAVRLIQPAAQSGGQNTQRGNVFNLGSPTKAAKAVADLTGANLGNQKTAQEIELERRKFELERQKYVAELAKNGLQPDPNGGPPIPIPNWKPQPTNAPQRGGRPELSAPQFSDALAQYNAAAYIANSLKTLRGLNERGPGSTSGIAGLQDFLPTEPNKSFDREANRLRAWAKQGTGTTGGENNSLAEMKLNLGAYIPDSWSYDSTNEGAFNALEEMALKAQKEAVQRLGGIPDANGNITPIVPGQPLPPLDMGRKASDQKDDRRDPMALAAPTNGAPPMAPDPWNQNTIDPTKPSSGLFLAPETRQQQSDPKAAELANKVFAQTGSMDAVNAALSQAGYSERFPQPTKELIDYNKQNPGYGYFKPGLTTVQNSTWERVSGGAPAAAVAGYANAATGGTVGALTGKGLEDMAAAHPVANMVGEVGGAITGTAAIGKGAGALAGRYAPALLNGGKWANRARAIGTDAAYGGIYGGVTENDPLTGVVAGAGGSMLGRGLGKVGGRMIQGFKPTEASQYLATQGVTDQTLGQTLGGFAKSFEDRMSSVPGVGDLVNARRMESLQGFNRAAFRQAGEPIGAQVGNVGEQGLNDLVAPFGSPNPGVIDTAYNNATAGVRVPLDPQWPTDLQGIAAASNRLPPAPRANFAQVMDNTTGVVYNAGELTGDLYQNAIRSLKGYKANASTAAGGFDGDYKDALSLAQGALRGQMERGGGQSVIDGLGNADAAYRNYKTLGKAVAAAKNQPDQLFTPAQLNQQGWASAAKYPGPRPFAELADAGQATLPSKIPDSGTAGRLMQAMGGGLIGGSTVGGGTGYALGGGDGAQTGGALGGGGTLGLLGLLALGGTKGGQKALKAALVDSGSLTRAGAARLIRKGGGLFGKASIPLLLEQ